MMNSGNNNKTVGDPGNSKQVLIQSVITKYKAKLNVSSSNDDFSKMSISGSNIFDSAIDRSGNSNFRINHPQRLSIEDVHNRQVYQSELLNKSNNTSYMIHNNEKIPNTNIALEAQNKVSNLYQSIDLLRNSSMFNEILKATQAQMTNPKSQQKVKMSFNKFMALKELQKIQIINYLDSFDYFNFALASKQLSLILISYLKKVSKQIVDLFNIAYKRSLHCSKAILTLIKLKDNKGRRFSSNLVLYVEIFSQKLVNQTVSIGYLSKFYSDKNSYSNVYKFSVYNQSEPLRFWVMREYTSVSKLYISSSLLLMI